MNYVLAFGDQILSLRDMLTGALPRRHKAQHVTAHRPIVARQPAAAAAAFKRGHRQFQEAAKAAAAQPLDDSEACSGAHTAVSNGPPPPQAGGPAQVCHHTECCDVS